MDTWVKMKKKKEPGGEDQEGSAAIDIKEATMSVG